VVEDDLETLLDETTGFVDEEVEDGLDIVDDFGLTDDMN
jgi:hypothetical protein